MMTARGKDSDYEMSLNHDIIGHLCSYLCTKDIKTCRLVSSYWNYGATPVLKTRTSIALLLSPGDYGNDDPFPEGALETWNILGVVEKLKFCPTQVTLLIPSNSDNRLAEFPDFSVFPQTNNLKSISVEFPAGDQFRWQHELATKFVQSASTNLQELEFVSVRGDLNMPVALDFPSFGGSLFPKLRKLRVDIDLGEGPVPRIVEAITTSFPNLEHFVTECEQFVGILEAGLIFNWPESLKNLGLYGELTTDGMESLLKIPPGLKKLSFGDKIVEVWVDICDFADDVETIFYKFLQKQAPTLENLEVGVVWSGTMKNVEWKFPVFPVLKSLYVHYNSKKTEIGFETGPGSGNFGGINYHVGFPVLEVFDVTILKGKEAWLESFLPSTSNRQLVQSVRKVRVRIPEEGGKTKHIMFQRLLDMFPNAKSCNS